MATRKKVSGEEQGLKLGEFRGAIAQICEEKGISKDRVMETVEAALAAAYKKEQGRKGQHIEAALDKVTGEAKFHRLYEVVDESTRDFSFLEESDEEKETVEEKKEAEAKEEIPEEEKIPRFNSERDIILKDAKKKDPNAKVGDFIQEELKGQEEFGRVAAQTAKQVIIQRIREAERDAMYDEYKSKEGEVVSGTIQRVEGRNVFVDLGKAVGVLFPSEQPERETYRIGQRLKVYVYKVEADPKGPGIILSRARNELIQKLFELEVPEIFAGTVEIKAIAREAGSRTKIAVSSNEDGVDPIGSCVGQKGTRVQAVIDELGGEKIDIIEWNDDVAKFISAALSPAKVLKVDINESKKDASVLVPDDQLSLAIGKQGQNVRLAAKLTGWRIDMRGEGGDKNTKEEKMAGKKSEGEAGPPRLVGEAKEVKEAEKEVEKKKEETSNGETPKEKTKKAKKSKKEAKKA